MYTDKQNHRHYINADCVEYFGDYDIEDYATLVVLKSGFQYVLTGINAAHFHALMQASDEYKLC